VKARIHSTLLRVYRRLPVLPRRWIVRTIAPSFTVGAICLIERANGDVLLSRQTYRRRWGIPGGLLQRGEEPAHAARREVFEEIGLVIELLGEPAVVVDARPQRIDIVFRARPAEGADPDAVAPCSPEIAAVRWFPRDELPELQFEAHDAITALTRQADGPPPLRALPPLPPPDERRDQTA
jgi:8-oxo-dGTP pyrophosphatase MutT (NUDIX family)